MVKNSERKNEMHIAHYTMFCLMTTSLMKMYDRKMGRGRGPFCNTFGAGCTLMQRRALHICKIRKSFTITI